MTTTHGDTSDNASMPSQDESALILDEPALIHNESKLMQDLAMAPTAEMRRYRLGKSVSISDILWRCCKMLKNMWCLW